MTKKQRAQVVELLKLAADIHGHPRVVMPIFDAAAALGHSTDFDLDQVAHWACDAIQRTRMPCSKEQLLLAAARVEAGDWP